MQKGGQAEGEELLGRGSLGREEMVGVVEKIMEVHVRVLAEKVSISFEGLYKDVKGVFKRCKKRWHIAMAREAKGGKSHKRETRRRGGKEWVVGGGGLGHPLAIMGIPRGM